MIFLKDLNINKLEVNEVFRVSTRGINFEVGQLNTDQMEDKVKKLSQDLLNIRPKLSDKNLSRSHQVKIFSLLIKKWNLKDKKGNDIPINEENIGSLIYTEDQSFKATCRKIRTTLDHAMSNDENFKKK